MPFRSWLSVFILVFIIPASQALAQTAAEDVPKQEESTADANDGSKSQNSNAVDLSPALENIEAAIRSQNSNAVDLSPALENIEAAIRDLIAEEDKVAAEAQQRSERRDLEAQEGMAWWAQLMFYATSFTVLLTIVALHAIIRTLHHTGRVAEYTRLMLGQAESTTKAAQESITVTRDIGEAQTRAYFGLDTIKCKNIKLGEQPTFFANFLNSGQTPASGVTIKLGCKMSSNPTTEKYVGTPKPNQSVADVGGGVATPMAGAIGRPLTESQLAKLKSGQISIMVVGFVFYRCIFKKTRRCVFRMHSIPNSIDWETGTTQLGFASKNNRNN